MRLVWLAGEVLIKASNFPRTACRGTPEENVYKIQEGSFDPDQ